MTEEELNEVTGGDGIEWLYEKTYVVLNNACHSESIYDVIGGWLDHYYIKANFVLWQIAIIVVITAILVSSILLLVHNLQHKNYKNKIRHSICSYKSANTIEDIKKWHMSKENNIKREILWYRFI